MNKPVDPFKRENSGPVMEDALADEELDTIKLLQAGLQKLDEQVLVSEPKLQWLEAQIAEYQTELRKRLVRDLALFLAVALMVLFAMTAALLKVPAVFILFQAAVLLAAPLFLASKQWKRVKGL